MITDFRLSCMRLLTSHPLYEYITTAPDGTRSLNVLLMGSGSRLDVLLREVLTCGQILDVNLDVTLLTQNAGSAVDAFLKRAPAASDYLRIIKNYESLFTPDNPLATVRFEAARLTPEAMPNLLLERSECAYILISTGDDDRNKALALACAPYEADKPCLVAYVQNDGDGGSINQTESPLVLTHSFGPGHNEQYLAATERIAFNLHYCYAKAQDPRMPLAQIQADFQQDYNYISSMEAAVHIRTKLACAGITAEDARDAAAQFAQALKEDATLLGRLSALEHQRWLLQKILQGYRPMLDISLIYSGSGITTRDSAAKWHCCLVPCDSDGLSQLMSEDWNGVSEARWAELDPLDRMALEIHRACGSLAQSRRLQIDQIMDSIRSALALDSSYSAETIETARRMEAAVTQLWQHKKSAIPLYRSRWKELKEAAAREGKTNSFLLTGTLDQLNDALAPLVEYVSCKDYKDQDRLLVEQIPFALIHNASAVLCKVLSEQASADCFSAWQTEPRRCVFLAVATDEMELGQVKTRIDRICTFLEKQHTELEFHILAPVGMTCDDLCDGQTLHVVHPWTTDSILRDLEQTGLLNGVDYVDVTGGDPMLVRATEAAAEHGSIPIFYTKQGRFQNLLDAEGLSYPRPVKALTVKELFDLSGAIPEENEGEKNLDLSEKFKALWAIANSTPCWDGFCKEVSAAYRACARPPYTIYPPLQPQKEVVCSVTGATFAVTALLPSLRKLESLGFLKGILTKRELGDQTTVTYTLPPNTTSADAFRSFLQRSVSNPYPSTFFTLTRTNSTPNLFCNNLYVKDLVFPEEFREPYEALLNALEQSGFILNHRCNALTAQHSFTISSREVLACFQKSGTILEYMIYYSALLDGDFDDVEMGWKFAHSSGADSAENEIDVICTKGTAALFISAKMLAPQQLSTNTALNHILYEIAYLAQRFGGTNAKAVLVAPSLRQFDIDPQTNEKRYSNAVKLALRRGVYLLGGECLQEDNLGRILTRIAEGREDWCDGL